MKKALRIHKDEPIHKWIDRIAVALKLTDEQREAMLEVSKQSYIRGSDDAYEIFKTHIE